MHKPIKTKMLSYTHTKQAYSNQGMSNEHHKTYKNHTTIKGRAYRNQGNSNEYHSRIQDNHTETKRKSSEHHTHMQVQHAQIKRKT